MISLSTVKAFLSGYFVDKKGQVYNWYGESVPVRTEANGYKRFDFRDDNGDRHTIRVHQLVALQEHYYERFKDEECVRHLDANRGNNNADNIEIGTYEANSNDIPEGERQDAASRAVLTKKLKKERENMIVIYRPRSGEPAAAIANIAGITFCHQANYNSSLPENLLINTRIYLFGVTYTEHELDWMAEAVEDIYFFDHRDKNIQFMESARKNNSKLDRKLTIFGDQDIPMTIQVWNHFFPDNEKIPDAVYYFGKYMVWDLEDISVLHFHYGLSLLPVDQIDTWKTLIRNENNIIATTLKRGRMFHKYYDAINQIYADELVYDTEFDGIPVVAANTRTAVNSLMFDYTKHDVAIFGLLYQWDNKNEVYIVSIYKLNGSEYAASDLAAAYGGGGSSQAAGFRCKELPFKQMKRSNNVIKDVDLKGSNKIVDDVMQQEKCDEESMLHMEIHKKNQKHSYAQYESTIYNHPVVMANLPHLAWSVDTRCVKTADIKVSWYWSGKHGQYVMMFKDLTESQTDLTKILQTLQITKYKKLDRRSILVKELPSK